MRVDFRYAATVVCCLGVFLGCGSPPTEPGSPPPPPPPPPPPTGTVVIDNAPLGPDGGVLRVENPASPLNGLTIAVPRGTYQVAGTWQVTALTGSRPTLPPGAVQIGPTIRFENSQGYGALPFTITLPARVSQDTAVAAFFFDASSGKLELIPLLGRTDSTITVLTRHVDGAELLSAPPTSTLVMPGLQGGKTPASVVIAAVGDPLLLDVDTGFKVGVDDWDLANRGSYLTPRGYGAGAALGALWHFYKRRASEGPLFGRYDRIPDFNYDNPRGVRLSSVIQAEVRANATFQQRIAFVLDSARSVGEHWVLNQARALALALYVTKAPQLAAAYETTAGTSLNIIAYAVKHGVFSFSSSQSPGAGLDVQFTHGEWQQFAFGSSLDEAIRYNSQVFVMSLSTLQSEQRMRAHWAAFDNGTIGDGQFPALIKEFRDPVDTAWRPLTDTIITASESLFVRTRCPGCNVKRAGGKARDRIFTPAYTGAGELVNSDIPDDVDGTRLRMEQYDADYGGGLLHTWFPNFTEPKATTIDWTWLVTRRVHFDLSSEPERPQVGEQVTLTLADEPISRDASFLRWSLGADVLGETSITDPHSFQYEHRFDVTKYAKVELFSNAGIRLAVDSLEVPQVSTSWQIETIGDADELFDGDATGSGDLYDLLHRLLASPASGMIAIAPDDTQLPTHLRLDLRVRKVGTWTNSSCCPVAPQGGGEWVQLLGRTPPVQFAVGPFFAGWDRTYLTQSTEDPSSGTMESQFIFPLVSYQVKDAGSQSGPATVIQMAATRNGSSMTGTLTFVIWFSDGDTGNVSSPEGYRFPFTATRMR